MVQYRRVNQQFSKLKDAVKQNNGTTLGIGNKNFNKAE